MQEDVLRKIIAEAPFGYAYHRLVLDAEGRPQDYIFLEVNRAFEDMTGLRAQDILGRRLTEVIPEIKEDSFDWVRFYGGVTLEGGTAETVRCSKTLGGWYRVTAFSPEPHHFVTIFQDVTSEMKRIALMEEQQEKISKLLKDYEYLSIRDPLTGLFNRRFIEEKLKEIEASEHRPYTVLIADVNGLKFVNEFFGYQEGDRLLKAVARVLERSCDRESFAARWGGDEFLLLLPGGPEQAEKLAARIKARAAKVKGTSIAISLAVGWAAKTDPGQSFYHALKEAEENMYRNKLVEGRSYRRSIVDSLVNTLNLMSIETREHCERIRDLCIVMAERLGLSARERDELVLLALLHDIGKIGLSEAVLNKPGPLTEEEWEEIRRHPEIGYRIAGNTPELAKVADLILYHHERWDGKGYPWGLMGEEIPYLCRIMAVVDAYDAMTGPRPYRKPLSLKEALLEIERNAGSQFDPDIARLFLEIMVT